MIDSRVRLDMILHLRSLSLVLLFVNYAAAATDNNGVVSLPSNFTSGYAAWNGNEVFVAGTSRVQIGTSQRNVPAAFRISEAGEVLPISIATPGGYSPDSVSIAAIGTQSTDSGQAVTAFIGNIQVSGLANYRGVVWNPDGSVRSMPTYNEIPFWSGYSVTGAIAGDRMVSMPSSRFYYEAADGPRTLLVPRSLVESLDGTDRLALPFSTSLGSLARSAFQKGDDLHVLASDFTRYRGSDGQFWYGDSVPVIHDIGPNGTIQTRRLEAFANHYPYSVNPSGNYFFLSPELGDTGYVCKTQTLECNTFALEADVPKGYTSSVFTSILLDGPEGLTALGSSYSFLLSSDGESILDNKSFPFIWKSGMAKAIPIEKYYQDNYGITFPTPLRDVLAATVTDSGDAYLMLEGSQYAVVLPGQFYAPGSDFPAPGQTEIPEPSMLGGVALALLGTWFRSRR